MKQVYQFRVRQRITGEWRAWLDDDETMCAEGNTPFAAIRALCDLLEAEWGAER